MKKIVLILVFGLSIAGTSFAQNNIEGMRFLTVNALMQYGQQLYDRGDFNEACAVFDHVLTFDSHQSQALDYLKKMGHSPLPTNPIPDTPLSDDPQVTAATLSDTESLKKAVEAKKRVVDELRAQVAQLRANMAAQTVNE